MNNKVKIFLEDDNEILGNGIGDPHELQFLTTKEYLRLLISNNIKSTFYIDMGHYLFLLKNKNNNEKFEKYLNSIEETIRLLIEHKMDVQLHVHSQWHNAEIISNNIQVTNNWNLGGLDQTDQDNLLNESFDSLEKIFEKFNLNKKITSYKAGSWGLQPFDNIHRGMIDIKGKVYRQRNERLRTYNTSLNPAAWEFLENGGGNSGREALPIFGEDKYVDVPDLFEDSNEDTESFEDSDEDTENFEDPDDTGDKKKSEESLAVTTRVHSGMRRTYKRRTPKQEKKDSVKKTKKKQDDFGLSQKVFSRGFRRKALSDRTIGISVQLEDGMSGTDD